MSTIVTRAGKGSPLTNTEVDANFTNLNADKAEKSGGFFTGNLGINTPLYPALSLYKDGVTCGGLVGGTFGVGFHNTINGDLASYVPAGTNNFVVAGVCTALNLQGHNNGDQTAATVPNTPAGGITATNVQAALNELDSKKISLTSGTSFSFRNKLINGNFDIWQRNLSSSVPGYTTADRWCMLAVGSTCTASAQFFIVGQTEVPNEPPHFARYAVSSVAGANNYAAVQQRIEGVRTLAGKTVTISFYAKADANRNIGIDLYQVFGSGGSTAVSTGAQQVALTTAWQKKTITITLPSISGKTIGTGSWLELTFWFDCGATLGARTGWLGQQSGTFDIAQVQVEEGVVATPFEMRPYGIEFALCQRYYEVVISGPNFTGATSGMGSAGITSVPFKTVKRISPTIANISMGYYNIGTGMTCTSHAGYLGGTPYYVQLGSIGLTNFNGFSGISCTADAEI